ncbi:MAG: helix-turn-helix domain-containing protein [Paludibacter sp.]|jgi:HTH-type transcriptional regulator/antitoxin HigA|nr:helix-turn-helix domain-containing protein [Paludibacter sp.]
MKKLFENVSKLTTREDYDKVLAQVKVLIKEATENGCLDDPESDNEYIREIGRLGILCAQYENEYIQFKHLNVRKKSPLIRNIEDEMYSRNIRQKELSGMLGVNEPTLSQVMRGKRAISLRMAKRLYTVFNIDPKIILEYA